MDLVRKFIGPKSKYQKDLPYTYEARVNLMDSDGEFNSYISDTICGLVKYLKDKDIDPSAVEIFELYNDKEVNLEVAYCLSPMGKWLNRSQLCKSFREYYPGHIGRSGCTFKDRDKNVTGL